MTTVKAVNLALQGGGAHGAFTWGVLDRLLEDPRLVIDGISGTSAGAMNAVVLADGMVRGGRDGAREALETFWRRVSVIAMASPLRRSPIDVWMGTWNLDTSPAYIAFDVTTRLTSPYEVNPLNFNPLRAVLEETVDFAKVRACRDIRLFVSATNVETGRARVFSGERLTLDAVMASACLPFLFQAVEIDGVPYWDGGYMGNPVLYPFFSACAASDVIVVRVNPIRRHGVPKSAREILNRMNEITFNASLLSEFRAINFVTRLLDEGRLDEEDYKRILVHMIWSEEMEPLGTSSKMNAEWPFLTHLFQIGRQRADDWLREHFDDIGRRPSLDLRQLFHSA